MVIQDVRGSGVTAETEDESSNWIAAQSWKRRSVGMTGSPDYRVCCAKVKSSSEGYASAAVPEVPL